MNMISCYSGNSEFVTDSCTCTSNNKLAFKCRIKIQELHTLHGAKIKDTQRNKMICPIIKQSTNFFLLKLVTAFVLGTKWAF